MIDKIDSWEKYSKNEKRTILAIFIENTSDNYYLTEYFENYRVKLTNNTLNYYIKGVLKH